jgi:hypothetical protein
VPHDFVEGLCRTCLRPKAVAKRLCSQCPVPKADALVPEGDAGLLEQRGVSVPQDVPAHSWPVEIPESMDEGLASAAVVPSYWKLKCDKYLDRARTEWDDPLPGSGLRPVDAPVAGEGAPDVEDMVSYVAWLYGDGLPPAEPGEQDELGDEAPDPGHGCHHLLRFVEGEFVVTCLGCGESWAILGKR